MGRELQLSPVLLSLCPSTATLGLSEHPGGGDKAAPRASSPHPHGCRAMQFPSPQVLASPATAPNLRLLGRA